MHLVHLMHSALTFRIETTEARERDVCVWGTYRV